jgi:hypothetical protein
MCIRDRPTVIAQESPAGPPPTIRISYLMKKILTHQSKIFQWFLSQAGLTEN